MRRVNFYLISSAPPRNVPVSKRISIESSTANLFEGCKIRPRFTPLPITITFATDSLTVWRRLPLLVHWGYELVTGSLRRNTFALAPQQRMLHLRLHAKSRQHSQVRNFDNDKSPERCLTRADSVMRTRACNVTACKKITIPDAT